MLVRALSGGGGGNYAAASQTTIPADKHIVLGFKPKKLICSFAININGRYYTWVLYYDEDVSTTTYVLQQDYTSPPSVISNEPIRSNDPLQSIDNDGFTISPDAASNFSYIAIG